MQKNEDWPELAGELNREYGLGIQDSVPFSQLEDLLTEKMNLLIQSDFEGLILLLYRIDVDESKLRNVLKENHPQQAGRIIAQLILERLLKKIQSRRDYKPTAPQSDEEKW
jgi:hypothetical protein